MRWRLKKKGLLLSIQKTIGGGSPAGGLHCSTRDLPSWMMIGLILSFDHRGDPTRHDTTHNTSAYESSTRFYSVVQTKMQKRHFRSVFRNDEGKKRKRKWKISTWGEYDRNIEEMLHALCLNVCTFQNKCFDDGRHAFFFHMNNKKQVKLSIKWHI